MLIAVTPLAARAAARAGSASGFSMPIRAWPGPSAAITGSSGRPMPTTTPASESSSLRDTIEAPASA